MNDEFNITVNEEELFLLRAGLHALRVSKQAELTDRFTSPEQKRSIKIELLKIDRLLERSLS